MREFFSKLFFVLFILVCFCFFAALLSTIINPKYAWPVAFFGLGFPFIMLLLIFYFLYWLITKNKKLIFPLLLLLITLFALPHFFNINGPHKGEKKDGAIKIMTYNVRNFEVYDKEHGEAKREQLNALLQEEQPDVLCLQEVVKRKGFVDLNEFGESIQLPYYQFQKGIVSKKGSEFGIAIFSKFPIQSHEEYAFNSGGNVGMRADIQIDSALIAVFNIHLESINLNSNDYQYNSEELKNFDKEKAKYKLAYLANRLRSAYTTRGDQAKLIHKKIKNTPHPIIVCGDFNDTPVSYAYSKVKGNLKDTFSAGKFGLGATYPSIPFVRIDHIFISKHFKALEHKIIKKEISDHYPVVTTIQYKE